MRGGLDVGVALLADDVVDVAQGVGWDPGERPAAVVGKVTVRAPGTPEVRGALDHHGSRAEGLRRPRGDTQSQGHSHLRCTACLSCW